MAVVNSLTYQSSHEIENKVNAEKRHCRIGNVIWYLKHDRSGRAIVDTVRMAIPNYDQSMPSHRLHGLLT